jgi:hypothetical protein
MQGPVTGSMVPNQMCVFHAWLKLGFLASDEPVIGSPTGKVTFKISKTCSKQASPSFSCP